MKTQLLLKPISENSKLLSIIDALINSLKDYIIIEDLEGHLLLGQSTPTYLQRIPIIAAQQTIGWVKGGESAQVLADLLSYLVNQEFLTMFDDLTGVANRRFFDHYLQQEWRRSLREGLPLSLIICDLDYFKLYNDYYGHQAGDNCLQQVAQALSQVLKRPFDLVARYGGEEFAIILPNTDNQATQTLAQKLCLAIEKLQIPHHSSKVSRYVTLSIGIATLIPTQKATVEHLITTADQFLYCAKANGRNRYYPQNHLHNNKPRLELEPEIGEKKVYLKDKSAELVANRAATRARAIETRSRAIETRSRAIELRDRAIETRSRAIELKAMLAHTKHFNFA